MIENSNPNSIREWVDFLNKNRRQASALMGALIIMVFSGQHFAWGVFNNNFDSQVWYTTLIWSRHMTLWFFWLVASWFAAGAVGGYAGAKLVKSVKKIKIYVSDNSIIKL